MTEVIGVKFNKVGKVYYFDPKEYKLNIGDGVVVKTSRGLEFGFVAIKNTEVDDKEIVTPLKPIVRPATKADFERLEKNKEKEKEAFEIALTKIQEHGLNMKLVNTEYTFDGSKILFYFTADGRIDFRELVKSLASVFKTRIELRQMGVRDEAKTLGAIGICGRPLCCSTFLNDFHSVSIRMAKDQSLSLNPTKISGICSRLMCCLQYEQAAYEDLLKKVPGKGALVEYDGERGVVAETFVLKGLIKVRFGTQEEPVFKFLDAKDVKVLKKGKAEPVEEIPEEFKEN
ncbi:MAG: stage 0 sporulation family protein [Clostridia bacterium]|nr:stage 0 sporulation family protein [Clostridia bacterium]